MSYATVKDAGVLAYTDDTFTKLEAALTWQKGNFFFMLPTERAQTKDRTPLITTVDVSFFGFVKDAHYQTLLTCLLNVLLLGCKNLQVQGFALSSDAALSSLPSAQTKATGFGVVHVDFMLTTYLQMQTNLSSFSACCNPCPCDIAPLPLIIKR